MKLNKNTKMLVEGALMVALAYILDLLVLYKLPDGGSVTLKLVPIVFFAVRYGVGWGTLVGFVFGLVNYFLGFPEAIDWTSVICDYFLSFALLGFGAGLMKKVKLSAIWGSLVGGLCMFASNYLVGVYVWGKYMPETFLGMHQSSPYIYSFIYNITWAGPCIILACIVFALLYTIKPTAKLLNREDLK